MGSGNDGERSSRDKILIAAATMLGEDPAARLSVRAVAARAGVSTGSLRHFFPTQQDLLDTVIAGMYDLDLPDDPIHDVSESPTERLVGCLHQALAMAGTGESARKAWRSIYQAYVDSPPSEGVIANYLALERLGQHRIRRWLEILADEGAIPAGDIDRRARFLGTVMNGLSVERALPAAGPRMAAESDTLRMAVSCVVQD
ncbi:TetR/AcrR family transcriptional regulator [Dietzia psychralcaliphila]|uniref:TetR/AcrR family transcriptional regulator n=1 Tax=Dietzia psychralcaliphila TaxID=139021 RepID=UPI001C1DD0D6|nr:TetR/AcrR family transcriptional regulator [Dietzia psychralcaliphila]